MIDYIGTIISCVLIGVAIGLGVSGLSSSAIITGCFAGAVGVMAYKAHAIYVRRSELDLLMHEELLEAARVNREAADMGLYDIMEQSYINAVGDTLNFNQQGES